MFPTRFLPRRNLFYQRKRMPNRKRGQDFVSEVTTEGFTADILSSRPGFHIQVESHSCHTTSYNAGRRASLNLADCRKWEYLEDGDVIHQNSDLGQSNLTFSVVCYNVLAQEYTDSMPELYRKCNKTDLDWSVRRERIIRQLRESQGDILCLQEVQSDHYDDFFYPRLSAMGYSGLYKQKTGCKIDGCAIFYKSDKFTLKDQQSVEFLKKGVQLLDRDNIGLIAILTPTSHPHKELCVATTHLLFNPKREDVRLAQLQVMLSEIDHLAYRTDHYLPVIFCGDFNLNPSSSVYSFLKEGRLKYEHLEQRRLSLSGSKKIGKTLLPRSLQISDNCQRLQSVSSREESVAVFASGTLTHSLNLKSVYDSRAFPNVQARHVASTYQDDWTLVDYILYSDDQKRDSKQSKQLTLLGRYQLPTSEECRNLGAIPNRENGADHYHLQALFSWDLGARS